MNTRVISTLRDFDALAPTWAALTADIPDPSPFVSHDWFAACWRTAGPNRRREVIVFEDARGPRAAIPLVRSRASKRGLPVRALEFMAPPDAPFDDIPVGAPVDEVVEALLQTLSTRDDWDVMFLPKLPAHSAFLKALASALSSGRTLWRIAWRELTPHVALSGEWEDYLRSRNDALHAAWRTLDDQAHNVVVEEHRTVDPDGPVFADLMEVLNHNWRAPRGGMMTMAQAAQRFYRELTRVMSANGSLHLWILRLGGRPVAAEYQIDAGAAVYTLRSGIDPAVSALNPAARLRIAILRTLFERGVAREYFMGPGLIDLKRGWATGTHETFGFKLYARSRYGRLLHRVETRVLPIARRWSTKVFGDHE